MDWEDRAGRDVVEIESRPGGLGRIKKDPDRVSASCHGCWITLIGLTAERVEGELGVSRP